MVKQKKTKIKVHKNIKSNLDKKAYDDVLSDYISREGNVTSRELSTAHEVPEKTINKWIKAGDWETLYYRPQDLSPDTVELVVTAGESFGLTAQEESFCYHYLRTFNAKASALHAGYPPMTAGAIGGTLLKNDTIKAFLRTIKSQMNTESFLVASDIIGMYERIAFADINDFVEVNKHGTPELKSDFDGQVVRGIKEGKDGVTVDMIDKRWALEKLDMLHNAVPNKVADKTLELQATRVNIEQAKLGESDRENLDDGFEEALNKSVKAIWQSEEDGTDDNIGEDETD